MEYRFKLIVPLTYKDVEVESEEVDLNNQEIALIKQLVKQSPSKRRGLMPILEDGAPELYDKLWDAIEQPLRDTVLEDCRKNGFVETGSIFSKLRETKNAQELKLMRASNRLAYMTYEYIRPRIKTGMQECEVAAEMERFMRIHGAKTTSFFTIVAFGENTANPHHETGTRKLKDNEAILLDFGCVYNNYCSDMTRSWWHGKKEPAEYTKIWKIVDTARKTGIKTAKIGVTGQAVDAAARGVIAKAGYGEYFTHRTGHGVGLDIHEEPCNDPTCTHKLEEGNITSVEPGIYLPGKYGVRLEDLIVVTQTGAKIITKK